MDKKILILVVVATTIGVGVLLAFINSDNKSKTLNNTTTNISSETGLSSNSSINLTTNPSSNSISASTINSSQNQSASLLSSQSNDGILTNEYLPNFKVKYDPSVWTKSNDIEFQVIETFPANLLLEKDVTFSNSVFNLQIGGIFTMDKEKFTCYKDSQYNLQKISSEYFLLVPKDGSKLNEYKLVHESSFYDLSLPKDKLELEESTTEDSNCNEAKYVTSNNFISTEFDLEKAKQNFKTDFQNSITNKIYINILLNTNKVPTSKDIQELTTLLTGIEGLE